MVSAFGFWGARAHGGGQLSTSKPENHNTHPWKATAPQPSTKARQINAAGLAQAEAAQACATPPLDALNRWPSPTGSKKKVDACSWPAVQPPRGCARGGSHAVKHPPMRIQEFSDHNNGSAGHQTAKLWCHARGAPCRASPTALGTGAEFYLARRDALATRKLGAPVLCDHLSGPCAACKNSAPSRAPHADPHRRRQNFADVLKH